MRKVLVLSILTGFSFAVCGCRAGAPEPDQPQHAESGVSRAIRQAEPLPSQPDNIGQTPAPAPAGDAQVAARTATDSRPVLVCFGDSLTAGYGTGPGESYPEYLQADLDHAGYSYRVDNQGVSGDTTKDGVARIANVLAVHPAIVVVEFGGNDGLRGLRIEDTRANLDTIVARMKSSGAKVALAGITLPPDYGPDYIRQFDQTYTLLAKKYRVPMLPFLLKNVYGVPGMMQRDATHATAQGNQIVARNVMQLVLPLLRK